jgi:hypothetical protein
MNSRRFNREAEQGSFINASLSCGAQTARKKTCRNAENNKAQASHLRLIFATARAELAAGGETCRNLSRSVAALFYHDKWGKQTSKTPHLVNRACVFQPREHFLNESQFMMGYVAAPSNAVTMPSLAIAKSSVR